VEYRDELTTLTRDSIRTGKPADDVRILDLELLAQAIELVDHQPVRVDVDAATQAACRASRRRAA
jgi:hypothetical protein